MKRVALVTIEKNNREKKGLFNNILYILRELFDVFMPNKIETKMIGEDITLYIIKMFMIEDTVRMKLEKIFRYIIEQEIEAVAFESYFMSNYYEEILDFIKHSGICLSKGDNISFPLIVNTLKKILKAKGLSLGETDVAMLTDESTDYIEAFIRYLAPAIKYLTYVCKEESNIRFIIDDIFDSLGFSIRVCTDLKQCIKEVNLIINLSSNNIVTDINTTSNIVIFNIKSITGIGQIPKNISVLNDILIDISPISATPLDNEQKYKLCEMYILSKLDKLYLLKQNVSDKNCQLIYDCFKSNGFRITGLDGINL